MKVWLASIYLLHFWLLFTFTYFAFIYLAKFLDESKILHSSLKFVCMYPHIIFSKEILIIAF